MIIQFSKLASHGIAAFPGRAGNPGANLWKPRENINKKKIELPVWKEFSFTGQKPGDWQQSTQYVPNFPRKILRIWWEIRASNEEHWAQTDQLPPLFQLVEYDKSGLSFPNSCIFLFCGIYNASYNSSLFSRLAGWLKIVSLAIFLNLLIRSILFPLC